MIGRSNHFSDIVCPYDEEGCARPYCHFWHSKDDTIPQQPSYAANVPVVQSDVSFMGYVGYVGNEVVQNVNNYPAYQVTNGYVGSIASTSTAQPSETIYKRSVSNGDVLSKERPRRRIPSPEEFIAKPKLPIELPVEDILDPSMDEAKINKKIGEVPNQQKSLKLDDYVKSVAVIDTRIEELQKAIEKEKKEKEKMISEFKSKAKNGVDYVVTKKNSSKEQKKQSSVTSKLPAYSGGYTPTPIAVLKSKAEKKNKIQTESGVDSSSTSRSVKSKEPLEKRLSIEELFDDEPPAKKARTKSADKKEQEAKTKRNFVWTKTTEQASKSIPRGKAASSSTNLDLRKSESKSGLGSELTPEQVKAAKKRIAALSSTQSYFQRTNAPIKKHPPNVAQLVYRYEKLQKEKEEIMKKVQEKAAQSGKVASTLEDEMSSKPSGSGSIGRGEKRVAHTANFTKPGDGKLMLLEPFSNGKVPYNLRMRYLTLFNAEFLKIADSPSEALMQAQQEEKALKDKAVTKGSYACSAINVLRRLRDATKEMVSGTETKSISHAAILEGKHHGLITVGKRKHTSSTERVVTESSFYDALVENFLLSEEQLEKNGFPLWKNNEKKIVKILANERDARKKMFVADQDLKRICCRCGAEFRLTPKLEYAVAEQCVYHWGRAFKTRTQGNWESRYNCCSSDLSVKGCCIADFHVTDSASLSELQFFTETPLPRDPSDPRSRRVFALDCEMVYTTRGLCLARISMVDIKDELALDILVRPRFPIVDCNTRFSGLTKDQLEKAEYSFEEAQQRLFELVNAETILIGHSLESDLKALRLVHRRVVDTSVVFPHRLGPPYKRALKTLASEVLQLTIQEDVAGHDSKEDSSACMKLMLNRVKQG